MASYTLTDLRTTLKAIARNAKDSTEYGPMALDIAIRTACNTFISATRFTKKLDTLALTAGTYTIDVSTITHFRPDMLLIAYLTGTNVKASSGGSYEIGRYYTEGAYSFGPGDYDPNLFRFDFQELNRLRIAMNLSQQPRAVAFDTWTTGMVYPTPDQSYTLNLLWSPPFTSWAYGVADGSGATAVTPFNLPDEILDQIMATGALAFLQQNEAEHAYATPRGKDFKELIKANAGKGGLGVRKRVQKLRRWFG